MSDSEDDSRQRYKISKTHQLITQLEQKINYANDGHSSQISQDSKRKTEFEKDVCDFEQKMQKLTLQQSQYSQTPNQSCSRSQILVQDSASPTKINQVVQLLQKKLETIEDEKHTALQSKVEYLHKQQYVYEAEQRSLLEESQRLKFELENLKEQQQKQEKQQLEEQRNEILIEQEEKLLEIQDQSQKLIEEEEIRKSNCLLELQQLQIDKTQLQNQLKQLQRDQELIVNHRDEVSHQLTTLMQLHNQMLQNDLKKKINNLEEQHNESQSQMEERPEILENLYQFNQQLQESMNQQLSMIRQELNEQKQINLDLLQLLNQDQVNKENDLYQNQSIQQDKSSDKSDETLLQQRYDQDPKAKVEFDQLFAKHKKQYFSKNQYNYQRSTKSTQMNSKSNVRKSPNKSKSQSKDKKQYKTIISNQSNKTAPLSFEQVYKKHIDTQLKKLNEIVNQSLNK